MRAGNRRFTLILACGASGLLAGCRDAAAPTDARPSPNVSSSINATVFVYNPAQAQTFELPGQHRIAFSAGAVCDPAFSSYGVTEWDNPCTPLTSPISITAVVTKHTNGHPRVDFYPELRFVPGSQVLLYLRDESAALDSSMVIQWCDASGQCVDEGAVQASAITRRDAALGIVFRAIKHFSGYMISSGRSAVVAHL